MATMTDIEYGADVLDMRDLIQRFEELDAHEYPEGGNSAEDDEIYAEWLMLESFLAEIRGMGGDEQWRGDWYPTGLIRDSYFEDYAQELAEDLYGQAISAAHWPLNNIDWEAAARELRQDYSSADLDGVTYWFR